MKKIINYVMNICFSLWNKFIYLFKKNKKMGNNTHIINKSYYEDLILKYEIENQTLENDNISLKKSVEILEKILDNSEILGEIMKLENSIDKNKHIIEFSKKQIQKLQNILKNY